MKFVRSLLSCVVFSVTEDEFHWLPLNYHADLTVFLTHTRAIIIQKWRVQPEGVYDKFWPGIEFFLCHIRGYLARVHIIRFAKIAGVSMNRELQKATGNACSCCLGFLALSVCIRDAHAIS